LTEAERKRRAALEAAGCVPLVVTAPENVRWLLCGRGRPVDVGSADYALVLRDDSAFAVFADIERSRVDGEERFAELGYETVAFPWHEGRAETVARLAGDGARSDAEVEEALALYRRELGGEEVERYRAAGADTAAAFVEALGALRPELTELETAAELARAARKRDLVVRVNLVAGEERQPLHRHPLPTGAPLRRHALLALTAEREGLHVSMTRIVSFGPPGRLAELVHASAEVDAAVISASRPGATHGELFGLITDAYARAGFPEEWRRHHQGGLTGYKGREVFAVLDEPTPLPPVGAVAWNPSVTGGGKSEDTVLVCSAEPEVLTRTPELPELEVSGLRRPAIVEL
jgi:Xaa-Pro aminopeptidase